MQILGSVELQKTLQSGSKHSVLDIGHKDLEMVLGGVDVVFRFFEIWGYRRDELWASGVEELLKDGKGVETAALHALELVAVFLAEGGVDSVIKTGGAEGNADGY